MQPGSLSLPPHAGIRVRGGSWSTHRRRDCRRARCLCTVGSLHTTTRAPLSARSASARCLSTSALTMDRPTLALARGAAGAHDERLLLACPTAQPACARAPSRRVLALPREGKSPAPFRDDRNDQRPSRKGRRRRWAPAVVTTGSSDGADLSGRCRPERPLGAPLRALRWLSGGGGAW